MPEGTYKMIDPKLTRDSRGEYHIRKGSPAIDAAKGNYPAIVVDMDDQPRTSKPDVGADELSEAPIKASILMPVDVGYKSGKAW